MAVIVPVIVSRYITIPSPSPSPSLSRNSSIRSLCPKGRELLLQVVAMLTAMVLRGKFARSLCDVQDD
jgi:hypothetical protein